MKIRLDKLKIHPELKERFENVYSEAEQLMKKSEHLPEKLMKLIDEDMKWIKKYESLYISLTKLADNHTMDLVEIRRKLRVIKTMVKNKEKNTDLAERMGDEVTSRMTQIASIAKLFNDGVKHLEKHKNDLALSLAKIELLETKTALATENYKIIMELHTVYSDEMQEEIKIYNTLVE